MPIQRRLPGADWHEGEIPVTPAVKAGARAYAQSQGLPYSRRGIATARANPENLYAIGSAVQEQQGTPQFMSEQMHGSYQALHAGIESQYSYLTRPQEEGGLGITHEVTSEDPYPTPSKMQQDVLQNNRIKTFASASTHTPSPAMPHDINDKFRAVHDVFGHLGSQRNFTRHGEEGAVQHHAMMFPPEAHQALMSELRGTTSGLVMGGQFPENRPYDLPSWASQRKAKQPSTPQRKAEGRQQRLF